MSLYPKHGVYKILLEISGLKKSVVINDLSLKPMSLNPKFTVLARAKGLRASCEARVSRPISLL